jgi:hypothetical protein
MSTILDKLKAVKTMPELDALRGETVDAMRDAGLTGYAKVQMAFIKAKNRLQRIPLKDRTW